MSPSQPPAEPCDGPRCQLPYNHRLPPSPAITDRESPAPPAYFTGIPPSEKLTPDIPYQLLGYKLNFSCYYFIGSIQRIPAVPVDFRMLDCMFYVFARKEQPFLIVNVHRQTSRKIQSIFQSRRVNAQTHFTTEIRVGPLVCSFPNAI